MNGIARLGIVGKGSASLGTFRNGIAGTENLNVLPENVALDGDNSLAVDSSGALATE